MDGFLGFLDALGRAIRGVLTLDTSLGEWLAGYPLAGWVAVTVAVLAGASTLLGNSVILFLNRIRGWRFGVSLLFNGLGFVALYALQALVISVVGYWVVGERLTWMLATQAVLLATAPMLFGFFELIPYLGTGVARVLQAWGVIALWTVVGVLYQVDRWTALLITLLGWGAMQLLSWLLAQPLTALGRRVWRLATGNATMLTAKDLLAGHPFVPVELHLPDGDGRGSP